MSWIHFDGGTEDRGSSAGGGGSTGGGGGWSRRPVLNEIRYAHLKERSQSTYYLAQFPNASSFATRNPLTCEAAFFRPRPPPCSCTIACNTLKGVITS